MSKDIIYQSRAALIAFLEEEGFGSGGGGSGAPTNAQYVTLATNKTLTAERVLTAGSNISLTDAGAGGTLTIAATGGGDVNVSGTPSNNQMATWTNATTIAGSAELTYDGSIFLVSDAAAQLQVVDTSLNYIIALLPANGPKIQFGDTDGSNDSFMSIGAYGGINNIDTEGRDFHLFGTNTTTGLYFDESAGTFGIGTTSPQVELHVSDAGSPQIRLSDPGAVDTQDVVAYTEYYKGDDTTRIGWCGYASTTNEHFTINNITPTGSFEVKTNNTTAFTVDYQGNADVVGDLTVTGGDIKDSGGDSRISWSDGGNLNLRGAGGTAALQIADSAVSVLSGKTLYVLGNAIADASFTTAIQFDGSGHVTTPKNPAFGVWDNDDQAISENVWTTIAFDQENYDVSGDFDGVDTFTAPVAGKYMLSAQVRVAGIDSSNSQYVWIKIITSNRTYYHLDGTRYYAGADYATPSLSVVADMDASDTAYVQILVRIGASTTQGSENENYTAFQGALIG